MDPADEVQVANRTGERIEYQADTIDRQFLLEEDDLETGAGGGRCA